MKYLTELDVAKDLQVSRSFLQKARSRGQGLPWVKISRAVRYPEQAVEAYLKANTRGVA